jgi:hypothetical protein
MIVDIVVVNGGTTIVIIVIVQIVEEGGGEAGEFGMTMTDPASAPAPSLGRTTPTTTARSATTVHTTESGREGRTPILSSTRTPAPASAVMVVVMVVSPVI